MCKPQTVNNSVMGRRLSPIFLLPHPIFQPNPHIFQPSTSSSPNSHSSRSACGPISKACRTIAEQHRLIYLWPFRRTTWTLTSTQSTVYLTAPERYSFDTVPQYIRFKSNVCRSFHLFICRFFFLIYIYNLIEIAFSIVVNAFRSRVCRDCVTCTFRMGQWENICIVVMAGYWLCLHWHFECSIEIPVSLSCLFRHGYFANTNRAKFECEHSPWNCTRLPIALLTRRVPIRFLNTFLV